MTSQEYKALSIKEFSKAAKVYETDDAGVYKMCRKDYPDVLAELERHEFRHHFQRRSIVLGELLVIEVVAQLVHVFREQLICLFRHFLCNTCHLRCDGLCRIDLLLDRPV